MCSKAASGGCTFDYGSRQTRKHRTAGAAEPFWLGIEAQTCGRTPKDARSRIGRGRDACSDRSDTGACSSAEVEYGAAHSSTKRCQSVGWQRLGLASALSLEPVERRMGSAALRAEPLLWLVGSFWWLG